MRAQASMEYLLLTAGMLVIYAFVFPVFLSSFQNASNSFTNASIKSIGDQLQWKAQEVNELGAGSMLEMRLFSPVGSQFNINDAELNVTKGENIFTFQKTETGVSIQKN